MHWPRVVVALVLTGVAGLLNTPIGQWLHQAVTAADGAVGHAIGRWTGVVVTGLLALTVFATAAFWVYHRKIDLRTLAVVATVPLTVTLIPGALGSVAAGIVNIVPTVVGGLMSAAFGIR
jgi:hypothetical protein